MFQNTLGELQENFILTPHIYEFDKLTGINHIEALKNPYNSLSIFREKTKASVILKDAVSFFMKDNDIYINYNPTVSMGKAGMGDILAGFIGSFLARKLNIVESAKLSLMIQSKGFNKAAKIFGNDSIQPKDLTLYASKILKRI